jgi:type IV pilus assembly protein PilY1
MRTRIKLTAGILLLAAGVFSSTSLYAAIATVPLFVSTSATPNVILLFDNSGSMNNIIWAPGYDSAVTYPDWANYTCDRGGQNQAPCWSAQEGNVTLSDIYDDRGSCNAVSVSARGTFGTARIRGVKGSTTRCLLLPDPVGAHTTRYTGNYLNYLFETYATVTGNNGRDLTTGLIPTGFRLQTAKNVSVNFVNDNINLRIGLASFNAPVSGNSGPGGRINAACGTPTSTLVDRINAFSASTNTPLAETLYEITRYFRGLGSFYNSGTSYNSPIQHRCQRNFAIVVTDGAPTFDRTFPTDDPDDPRQSTRSLPNWDGLSPAPPAPYSDGANLNGDAEGDTYYLDDIAKFGYELDMRTGGTDAVGGSFDDPRFPLQNLRTYTVGFTVANQMLEDAAFYGDGRYFTANNDTELNAALRAAISDIQTRTSAAASVATNSTQLTADTLIFQARFSTNDWSGQLLAFPVSSSGTVDSPAWDAKDRIPAHGSRNIVTLSSSTGVNFFYANLSTAQKNALRLKPDNTSGDDAYGTAVVNYLRGDDTGEAPDAQDFRPRTSRLGDIINSDPVFVGKQDYGFDVLPGTEGSDYRVFRASSAYQNRKPMIYVGANDGMLHGFLARATRLSGEPEPGTELFAYVPNAIIPNLRFLTEASRTDDPGNTGLPASGYNQKHRYYVDGSSRAIDAYLTLGGSTAWRSILLGALGAGGRGVFALNVTDPAALGTSTPLWEFTSSSPGGSEMGFAIPQPSMGRMYNGGWAAIVANGYDSAANTARLYILDLATGSVLKEFNTGVGTAARPNGLSSPIPVDVDQDRIVDFIYAGDLWGNLWKFDVTGNSVSQWDFGFRQGGTPSPLFTACTNASSDDDCFSTRQPITARPEVGSNPTGGQMVYFGTGKYFENCDAHTTTNGSTVNCATTGTATQVVQSFYAIRDLWTKGSTDIPVPVGSGRSTTHLLQQSVIAAQAFSFTHPDGSPGSEQIRATSNNPIDNTHKGWYIDLPADGERQVANPILRGGRVIFTTLIPNNDPCGFGGDSWLMELDALSGSRLSYSPFDLNDDGLFNIGDFITVTIGGQPVQVPVSGRKSKEGIIKTPAVLNDPNSGRRQIKLASGTTTGFDRIGENARDDSGRQSWRQLR